MKSSLVCRPVLISFFVIKFITLTTPTSYYNKKLLSIVFTIFFCISLIFKTLSCIICLR
nr:MAG TPA: hypothetical protein [Caudoviricetes sp.]